MRAGAVLAALALLAGCTSSRSTAHDGWRSVPLPARGARVLVLEPLDGGLLALGSVPARSGRAPGAWTTSDGRHWRHVPLAPATGYGQGAEFAFAAVDGPRVSAWGLAFGGAHSNPRPTLWAGTAAGLAEHEQPFTMFGGEDAITTDAAAAYRGTFLLAGSWDGASGRYDAAVWVSRDGARWTRYADAPGLAAVPGEQTAALGAAAGGAGFLVLGSSSAATSRPLAWTSPDGRTWTRLALPSTGPANAGGGACDAAGCVILGSTAVADQRVLCWTFAAGHAGPPVAGPGHGLVQVRQALLRAGRVYVVSDVDRVAHLVIAGRDCTGWGEIALPDRQPGAALGVLGSHLLLSTTGDNRPSRLWLR